MTNEHTPLLSSHTRDAILGPQAHWVANENLQKFRHAIGINALVPRAGDIESARHSSQGLYRQILTSQRRRSRQYYICDTILYAALGAQIIIGAALSALGPLAQMHPETITVLGVINTSIAGLLALMKGQGIPDRLRKDQFEMRKVQGFIEETDSRLVLAGDTLTLQEVDDAVQMVFLKYNAARDTAEMNRPDNYAQQAEGAFQSRTRPPAPAPLGQTTVVDPVDAVDIKDGSAKGKDDTAQGTDDSTKGKDVVDKK